MKYYKCKYCGTIADVDRIYKESWYCYYYAAEQKEELYISICPNCFKTRATQEVKDSCIVIK